MSSKVVTAVIIETNELVKVYRSKTNPSTYINADDCTTVYNQKDLYIK